MYVDQSGEFVVGYWGLRTGYFILGFLERTSVAGVRSVLL